MNFNYIFRRVGILALLPLSASMTQAESNLPAPDQLNSLISAHKGTPEQNLYLGRQAHLEYDFERAEKLFNTYAASKKRSPEGENLLSAFRQQLDIAKSALNNVQNISLISKSSVPETDFLSSIKLPSSAGVLLSPDSIPFEKGRNEASMAFANEARNYMLWSQSSDSDTETYILVESERLTDGSWTDPTPLKGLGDAGINADFPFMRSDGTTLYFSSPSEESMGGYDLFVAMRDPQTGEYLAPRNLGMPFNSPFDDIMVAIDEENGLAWLVSDRDPYEGRVTVYLYLFEESRTNHDPDSDEIIKHARLTADADYLPEDNEVRRSKLQAIENMSAVCRQRRRDFRISIPGRRTYEIVENFTSPQARISAGRYLSELNALKKDHETLSQLRSDYRDAKTNKNLSKMQLLETRILQLEDAVAERTKQLKEARNQTIQAETMR